MPRRVEWSGEALVPGPDNPEVRIEPVWEEDNKWVFLHVCAHCETQHAVTVAIDGDALVMRWDEAHDEALAERVKRPEYKGD